MELIEYLNKMMDLYKTSMEQKNSLPNAHRYRGYYFAYKDILDGINNGTILLNSENKINVQGSDSLRIHDVRECNASIDKSNASNTKSLDSELLEKRTDDESLVNSLDEKIDKLLDTIEDHELMKWLLSKRSHRSAT